ncbi:MAG: co-chaperone GroES [Clostridia bacterium]|nr:co-chaperone GroES [Clostridia bacterium]
MKLVPLFDRVVVEHVEENETTSFGLILTTNSKEKPQIAKVIAVGKGGMVNGNEVKMEVKVGDNVVYSDYAGSNVKLDGKEYVVIRQSDILAIVED